MIGYDPRLHSPDTLRPDHSVAPFIPGDAAPLDDPEIARRMARVILRQAGDGQATELRHFREAEETKGLSTDELVRHLGAARRAGHSRQPEHQRRGRPRAQQRHGRRRSRPVHYRYHASGKG